MTAVPGYPIVLNGAGALPPIFQGDPYPQTGPLKLEMKDSGGSYVNLTSYGVAWSARLKLAADGSDLDPVSFIIDATHAASGYLLLSLTGTQTAGMAPRTYVFDIKASGGSQDPFHVWRGSVDVLARVTP